MWRRIILEAEAGPALYNSRQAWILPWVCRIGIITAKFQMGRCLGRSSFNVLPNRNAELCAAANEAVRSTIVSFERGFRGDPLFARALCFQGWPKVAGQYAGADRFRSNVGCTQSCTYAPIQSWLSRLFANLP